MTDSYIQLPDDGTGKRVRAFSKVVGGQTVYHQTQVPVDADGNEVGAYSEAIDEVSSTLLYSGKAARGSATSAPAWRIKRVQKVGTVTTSLYALASGEYGSFNCVWDDRASLTYG